MSDEAMRAALWSVEPCRDARGNYTISESLLKSVITLAFDEGWLAAFRREGALKTQAAQIPHGTYVLELK